MTEFGLTGLRRYATACIVALLVAGCGDEGGGQTGKAAPPPPPVDVAAPVVKQITEWDLFTGRFEAIERVEVRSRVSGYLQAVHFQDGQIVRKGDALFTIDPRPYEAQVARANAEVKRARVALELAEKEEARAEKLLSSRNISEETVDSRRAAKLRAEAELVAAEAGARSARLDLAFTRIESPVTGRISDSKIDVGNLIAGGETQSPVLAIVVSLDPIYFVFSASESDYLKYGRLNQDGQRPSSRETANPVYVQLIDEKDWRRQGKMDFVDNTFNSGSGTITARAILDNPDHLLLPGLFGRMRLLGMTPHEAVLLPDAAVLPDQSNWIVYAVGTDGTVVPKRVVTGPIVDNMRVIRSGLSAEDRVIVAGIQRAQPGGKVTPNPVRLDPENGKIVPADGK